MASTVIGLAFVSIAIAVSIYKAQTRLLKLQWWFYLGFSISCLTINVAFICILSLYRSLYLIDCHRTDKLCNAACLQRDWNDTDSTCFHKWQESLILIVLDTAVNFTVNFGFLLIVWRYRREQGRINQISMAPPPYQCSANGKPEDDFQTIELR
ncbi:hypothetical protein DM01DRAFT_1392923 [Hesseltinella vesiculosa]|uniref:Uncharacterized protein n=1 Tax=Hesseltinella vesiculosa TaxID=101127 RepID=A0A1X2GDC5_9FUNG|nr:hypothetical protein DM01DRAFT_1392923 [Hesseltinella vesiculosa]